MPEANVLYSVTGVVVVGLVVWVALVLKSAKEPWARPAPPLAEELPSEDAPPEEPEEKKDDEKKDDDPNKLDADDTARATPVALSEGRTKAAEAAEEAEVSKAETKEKAES
ncbi:MAG: hypothetical protein KIT84_23055 [Labilithrix sp.]|nr:hypothetical protein [Labilithrix sp.]MCW5813925.1 hypothetical protein [Labilithrix sp.]